MMGEIYSHARCTWIWLGRWNDRLSQGLDCIRRADQYFDLSIISQEELGTHRENLSESVKNSNWKPLEPLCHNPWFTRIWIVQEVALSTHALLWGMNHLSFRNSNGRSYFPISEVQALHSTLWRQPFGTMAFDKRYISPLQKRIAVFLICLT